MKTYYTSVQALYKDFVSFVNNNEESFDIIEELSDYQSLDLTDDSIIEMIDEVKDIVVSILEIKIDTPKYSGNINMSIANEIDRNMRNIITIKKYFIS